MNIKSKIMTTVNVLIKSLSKQKGVTISEMADRIGISQSWLSGMVLYHPESMPMKRIEQILNSVGEQFMLSDGRVLTFQEYEPTLRSFRSIVESLGGKLEIKLSNGETYQL